MKYWMREAERVAEQSECSRRKVGAVIVRENGMISVGFNQPSEIHLSCVDCPRSRSSVPPGSPYDEGEGFCHAVHAEMWAVLEGDCSGATLYVNANPCVWCRRLMRAAGIYLLVTPFGEERL